jgi:hypothetical protein
MTETFTLECEVHFDRRGRGSRKVLETGPGATPNWPAWATSRGRG